MEADAVDDFDMVAVGDTLMVCVTDRVPEGDVDEVGVGLGSAYSMRAETPVLIIE